MLGNVLLKASTNGKSLTVFFDLRSWLFQSDDPEF